MTNNRMTNNRTACESRSADMAVLDTIAGILPRGIQRDSILSVMDWITANHAPDFTEEERQRIQSIYDRVFDEAAQKAVKWQVEGGEPEHGTRVEVPFIFNADTKTWELEHEMPPVWTEPNPDFLPQTEGIEADEDEG